MCNNEREIEHVSVCAITQSFAGVLITYIRHCHCWPRTIPRTINGWCSANVVTSNYRCGVHTLTIVIKSINIVCGIHAAGFDEDQTLALCGSKSYDLNDAVRSHFAKVVSRCSGNVRMPRRKRTSVGWCYRHEHHVDCILSTTRMQIHSPRH